MADTMQFDYQFAFPAEQSRFAFNLILYLSNSHCHDWVPEPAFKVIRYKADRHVSGLSSPRFNNEEAVEHACTLPFPR